MKKSFHSFVALLMIASFTSIQARAENITIESAINQLNYKLNVEWDQKDQKFKKEAADTFIAQVAQLQKQGVSAEQIVSALKAKMPDAQTAKDVDALAMQAKARNMNSDQVNDLVFNYMKKQATGASWSDSTVTYTAIALLVFVAVIVIGVTSDISVSG